ncbi:MAG TPA: extracellular solute-binding protein, partial [Anaerolineae bacterium]|nr:extracellular solute-binding protein [Anaerolineae bacterium]
PHVKIDLTQFPYQEMYDKLVTTLQAGSGAPDIADLEISQTGRFFKGKVQLVPLDDYLADLKDQLITSAALAPWSWQGKTYAVSNELNPVFMYLRWDLFKEAGLEEEIPTWDDFVEMGKEYVKATGKKFIAIPDQHWAYWWIIASAAGGGFFDAEGNFIADNEIGLEVLQFLQDLIYKHEIAMLAPGGNPWNPAYTAAMSAGEFATQPGAPWYQSVIKGNAADTAGKWHVTRLPLWKGQGSPTTSFGGTAMSITKQSKDPDAAWEFIRFLNFDTQMAVDAFKIAGLYPTYKPALGDPALQEPDPFFDNQSVGTLIAELAKALPPLYMSPFWPEITDAMNNQVLPPVLGNRMTPEEGMKTLREEAQRIMG